MRTQHMKIFYLSKILFLLIMALLFHSCASIINKPFVPVSITSNDDSASIYNPITNTYHPLPCEIILPRSKDDANLIYLSDSISFPLTINNNYSSAFMAGNIFPFFPYSYLIDLKTPKKYGYPRRVDILRHDSTYEFNSYNFLLQKKGLLNLKVSAPFINIFYYQNGLNDDFKTGFWGISTNLEYFLADQICISIEMGALSGFPTPFPSAIDYDQQFEHISALYSSTQVGLDLDKFQLNLGIQINQTRYKNLIDNSLNPKYFQTNLGLVLISEHKINNNFSINFKYFNSLFRITKATWNTKSTGLFSFGFGYKFNLSKNNSTSSAEK